MKRWYEEYRMPEVPYCVIGKVSWGVVQAIKIPEAQAGRYIGHHGWSVLIRDSEFPVPLYDSSAVQSHAQRHVDGYSDEDPA